MISPPDFILAAGLAFTTDYKETVLPLYWTLSRCKQSARCRHTLRRSDCVLVVKLSVSGEFSKNLPSTLVAEAQVSLDWKYWTARVLPAESLSWLLCSPRTTCYAVPGF